MFGWKCVGWKRHLENRHPHEGCILWSMVVLKPHFQSGITQRMLPRHSSCPVTCFCLWGETPHSLTFLFSSLILSDDWPYDYSCQLVETFSQSNTWWMLGSDEKNAGNFFSLEIKQNKSSCLICKEEYFYLLVIVSELILLAQFKLRNVFFFLRCVQTCVQAMADVNGLFLNN